MKRKIFALVLLFIASPTFAQPLIDKVPDSAALYIGWRGTADPGAAYHGSHTQAILNSGDFAAQWTSIVETGFAELDKRIIDQDGKKYLASVKAILPMVFKHPGAFYSGFDNEMVPTATLIIQADSDAKAIMDQINILTEKMPKDAPVKFTENAGLITIDIRQKPSVGSFQSIAGNATFKKSLGYLQKDAFVHVFVNVQTLKQTVRSLIVKDKRDAQYLPLYDSILKESGFATVESVAFTGGFEEKDWHEKVFVDAPSPRTGLLTLFEGKPFDADLLKHIPANSTEVSLTRFDMMKLLSEIKRITTTINPQAGDILNKGIGVATLAIGKNIETDLLDPLGSEWATYESTDLGDDPLWQTVLISKLDNGFKAKQGLSSFWLFIVNTANNWVPPGVINYKFDTVRDNELTIFTLKLTGFAPSWTVSSGYLYVGFDPRSVAAAARFKGAAVTENKTMWDLFGKLGSKDIISAVFYDKPKNMAEQRDALKSILDQYHKMIPEDVKVPTTDQLVPSTQVLADHTTPSGMVIWMDDAGIHGQADYPYPGSNLVTCAVYTKSLTDAINNTLKPVIEKLQEMQQRQMNRPPNTRPGGGL